MTTAFKISSFVMLFLVFAACTNKAVGTKTTATKAQAVPTAGATSILLIKWIVAH